MSGADVSAVVLAGTHNWSGSIFERLAPRPLVPVALEPLLSYSLRWLHDGGIRQVRICANGTTRAIESAFGDGSDLGMDLGYYEDGTPRGAAGCVRDAGVALPSSTFVVTEGAAIPTVDLADLLASHRASRAAVTAVVHRDRAVCGAPTPGGVYVFERRVLDQIGEKGFQDIKENLIPRLHRAGEHVVAYQSDGFCPHVFSAQSYLAVNEWMLERLAGEGAGGERALRHPTARVEAGARLVGPVQLGAGACVEAGATVIGPTSVAAGCRVARHALVARTALWARSAVGEGAVVHGCVVAEDAVIPAAARLFNVVRPRPASAPGSGRAHLAASPSSVVPPAAGLAPTSCTAG
jgi:mannose-1-phosphate guanylyltransferase